MRIFYRQYYTVIVMGILFSNIEAKSLQAEQITGKACYRYSDNESLNAAREIAISMAKRDALEGYTVFVNTTSTVEDYTLKNDLITTITAGLLINLKIIEQTEDLAKHEICRTIQAEVEPVKIKEQITAKINAFIRQQRNSPTGLPENDYIKILKVSKAKNKLIIVAQCKNTEYVGIRAVLRITHYDADGIPEKTFTSGKDCSHIGNINHYELPLPDDSSMTYSIDITKYGN